MLVATVCFILKQRKKTETACIFHPVEIIYIWNILQKAQLEKMLPWSCIEYAPQKELFERGNQHLTPWLVARPVWVKYSVRTCSSHRL